ncbi:MAG: hypothetical protein ACK41C_14275 [Phenylobacterium sp.]|jgi:hypothetical protein|uniref:hypothetical protein n=1 Tax=Phenylobacterium sp. TaxID=1871053 RepID=UPI00391A87E0
MRKVLLVLPVLALAGACTTTRADGSPQVQTTSEAKRESVEGALTSPLRDVNLLRNKIPPVLLDAIPHPYERPAPASCENIRYLVMTLNAALGPDLDEPDDNEESLMMRSRDTALGAMAGLASDIIPFRGWVRKLTGAEQHDRLVAEAITAGGVRRAYLKGLGEARGCNPPATPSHVKAGREPIQQELRPRYPIR